MAAAHYFAGVTLLQLGHPIDSESAARRFLRLSREPGGAARGRLLLARALRQQQRFEEAAEAYGLALTQSGSPDEYLEHAQTARRAGGTARALAVLEQAQQRLGRLTVLVERAVELGSYGAALARLDLLIQSLALPFSQLNRKGDILRRMNRRDDAHQSYSRALDLILGLNTARRRAPAVRRLEREIRHGLKVTR